MEDIVTLPRFQRQPAAITRDKSATAPKWHFWILASLILIGYVAAILYAMPAQVISLIAFFALALCYFVDALCYQKSDQRLKAIIQASPNPVIVYSKQGHPKILNRAFTEVFGWTLDELGGKCIPFVPEEEKPITGRKIAQIFRTGRPVSFETRRLTKTGDSRNVIVSAAIAMGRDNTPDEMVVNITDITERKKFESRLQQAIKMEAMGTLAGGIAHDFNNILSPLIGYCEMLIDDIPDNTAMHEKAEEILTAGMRAKELVQQVLACNRKSDNTPKSVKLQPIITETLKLIRASIPSTIQLQQEIDADCGPVVATPTQIHQVLMNLATNAYHAMENTGGKLSVTLNQVLLQDDSARSAGLVPGRYAHLVVADTGTGIDEANMAKIFDPYFTTKDKNIGTGLGLSVVHGIITSLGGNIRAISKPGQGSEFHIHWPLSDQEARRQETNRRTAISGDCEKILLVDDEPSIIRMMRQMLEYLGYQVDAYESSTEALAAFKADPWCFDLVLSDMTMPKMTGDRLAKEILAIRPAIPVIISTGYNYKLTSDLVRMIGIRDVLLKPASRSNLSAAVRKALDENPKAPDTSAPTVKPAMP